MNVTETTAEIISEAADIIDPEYTNNLLLILDELVTVNSNLGLIASILVYILVCFIIYGLYKLFKSLFIS